MRNPHKRPLGIAIVAIFTAANQLLSHWAAPAPQMVLEPVYYVAAASTAYELVTPPHGPPATPKPTLVVSTPKPSYAPKTAHPSRVVETPKEPSTKSALCGGGVLPPCSVMRRESGGDPRIWNGGCYAPVGHRGNSPCGVSSASGLYQFVRGTWNNFGGFVNAADAPVSVQLEKTKLTWANGAGRGHWGM